MTRPVREAKQQSTYGLVRRLVTQPVRTLLPDRHVTQATQPVRTLLLHAILVAVVLAGVGCATARTAGTGAPAPDPQATPSQAPDALAPLSFLEGAWRATQPDGSQVEERWTAPRGGMMLATNQAIRGGETVMFEFLRIEALPEGVFYFPSPRGKERTPFRMVHVEGNATRGIAVFENPDNEFPMRITYRREGDSLIATLEGKGQPDERIEFRRLPR